MPKKSPGKIAKSPSRGTTKVPRRLGFLKKDAADLYIRTGNQCAFDPCTRPLINDDGEWVGQVCHIEAAMPGGERFNKRMTDDERRRPENLILLCYEHHIVTNNVDVYTVERLKEMKAKHEAKYGDVARRLMEAEARDLTRDTATGLPRNLHRFDRAMDPQARPLTDEEFSATLETITAIAGRLADLPPLARAVLAVVVSRGDDGIVDTIEIPATEVQQVMGLSFDQTRDAIAILDRRGLTFIEPDDSRGGAEILSARAPSEEWPEFWRDLKEMCAKEGIPVEDVIRDIRFDSFELDPEGTA